MEYLLAFALFASIARLGSAASCYNCLNFDFKLDGSEQQQKQFDQMLQSLKTLSNEDCKTGGTGSMDCPGVCLKAAVMMSGKPQVTTGGGGDGSANITIDVPKITVNTIFRGCAPAASIPKSIDVNGKCSTLDELSKESSGSPLASLGQLGSLQNMIPGLKATGEFCACDGSDCNTGTLATVSMVTMVMSLILSRFL